MNSPFEVEQVTVASSDDSDMSERVVTVASSDDSDMSERGVPGGDGCFSLVGRRKIHSYYIYNIKK